MKLLFLANAALLAILCLAPKAGAQIHAITFTLDSGDDYALEEHALNSQNLESEIRIQGTAVQDFLPDDGIDQKHQAPLSAQKDGLTEQTYTGRPSDYSPWGGTLTAVVDLTNGKLQLLGGDLVAKITGAYCPGPNPTQGGPNACPTEADAQYGFSLDVAAGSVEAATRDLLSTLTGPSDVVGTQIDTLNWHFFVLQSNTAYDDDGAIDGEFGTDTLVVPGAGDEPLVGHNENDPDAGLGTVNESTFYKGTFSEDGTDAAILIPINGTYFIPLADTDANGDGIPDDHVRILFTGELKGEGPLGATLTPGDFNQDGEVNGLDVNILSLHHGTGEDHTHTPDQLEQPEENGVPHPHYALWTTGDANFDSIANNADLAVVATNFAPGGAGAGTHAVPEPGGLCLAGAALALLALARRHRICHNTVRRDDCRLDPSSMSMYACLTPKALKT